MGGEALPGGLAEINGTIQADAEAASRKRQFLLQDRRNSGLIAIAGRWMKKAAWFS